MSTLHDMLMLIPNWIQEPIKASRAYITNALEGSNFRDKLKQPRENCDHPILGRYIILDSRYSSCILPATPRIGPGYDAPCEYNIVNLHRPIALHRTGKNVTAVAMPNKANLYRWVLGNLLGVEIHEPAHIFLPCIQQKKGAHRKVAVLRGTHCDLGKVLMEGVCHTLGPTAEVADTMH